MLYIERERRCRLSLLVGDERNRPQYQPSNSVLYAPVNYFNAKLK